MRQRGLFLADWTFGKVHFVGLEPAGATYTGRSEVFLESVGSNGFAPSDVASPSCLDHDCLNEDVCGPPGRFWVSAEYLLWWTKSDHAPPLVTVGPPESFGILGAPPARRPDRGRPRPRQRAAGAPAGGAAGAPIARQA